MEALFALEGKMTHNQSRAELTKRLRGEIGGSTSQVMRPPTRSNGLKRK
jgi:hypothetical protein